MPDTPSVSARRLISCSETKLILAAAELRKISLDCTIGSDLPLAIKQPLQVDSPQRRRCVVARQLQPLPGADLVLQPKQRELVGLHLAREPLADETSRPRASSESE